MQPNVAICEACGHLIDIFGESHYKDFMMVEGIPLSFYWHIRCFHPSTATVIPSHPYIKEMLDE